MCHNFECHSFEGQGFETLIALVPVSSLCVLMTEGKKFRQMENAVAEACDYKDAF